MTSRDDERDVQGEPVEHFPPGTGRPASGAFFQAGYRSVEELAGASESELAKLHGVGPKALRVVKAALEEQGLDLNP
ncbi:helix-hairpin-helix domain-containing protein [Rhodococcus sovatensis]|uniref:Helix-hairpin-helix domain-containing protein n=1 Tax=Rhodococcus sovatensis TaxID=1805840 RepID=A0ABZ2PK67_9NOCA